LRNFEQSWKNSDFQKFGVLSYERFSAIIPPENIENLKPLMTNAAFDELIRTESRGMRLHDESLTRGAVGCYLSHYTIWQQSIANGYKHVLIFEDDAVLHPEFCSIMMLQQVANDWSILKAGYYCIDCNETPYNYVELKKDWCLHAYFLNTTNIQKFMNDMIPMSKQIDWQLHSVGAPMYGTIPVLSYQENAKFDTTVQTQ
jgi:GR25 family glycosyltransferase involved in LPS biosynthesis